MFFGMGGQHHGHGGKGICGDNNLLLILLLAGGGCNINKDDILELLFLVMLLECFGCNK